VSKTSSKQIKRVKELYFQDGRMPIKIYRMTGIPLDIVKRILEGAHGVKTASATSHRNDP
jgi:hypothetical protein